ncbi:MAG: aspartyl/asparaginyl beta-hydroxylase domain-containing protein [Erythrobacter sp.]
MVRELRRNPFGPRHACKAKPRRYERAMSNQQAYVQTLLAAADQARRAGDWASEARNIEAALTAEPGNPVALNFRGMRALAERRFAEAISDFSSAASADPEQPILWVNLATAYRGAGDDRGERTALETALSKDRFHMGALVRKAELEERAGAAKDAALAWNAVLQVAKTFNQPTAELEAVIARGRSFIASHADKLSQQYDHTFGADRSDDPDLRRFNRCLDIVLGRSAVFRNECQGVYFPFLPADEFFDKRLFPWLSLIEERTDAIRREALALVADPGEALRPYVKLDEGTPESKWTKLDGSLDWGACFLWEYGKPNQPVLDRCPATAEALSLAPDTTIPGKAPTAFFSILKAGKYIPPHTGVTNTRAIIHLPLVVPGKCRFRVGSEIREWVEGEAFAFDDTIDHEAVNESDKDRIVLIFDTWNPHLTEQERQLLTKFYAMQLE